MRPVLDSEFSRLNLNGSEARPLGSGNIGFQVITDHDRVLRHQVHAADRQFKESPARFADHRRGLRRSILDRGNERAQIQSDLAFAAAIAVTMQSDENRSCLYEGENPVEAVPAESLVEVAHNDSFRVIFDQLEIREILGQGFRCCQMDPRDALCRQKFHGGGGGREDLIRGEGKPEALEARDN